VSNDEVELCKFIVTRWGPGCWLGDAAREALASDYIEDHDSFPMEMAREGYYAGESHQRHELHALTKEVETDKETQ